ncbi:uncharacterized protein [Pagrus major]|uniref:uncharacterized protein n=1 Tax=Pagrus major TaxID=143350 RepID=UPI003CC8418D
MGLDIVSKLLLMTFLLQLTEERLQSKTQTTPEPDTSVRFGEFCLRMSDDSKSVNQKPTKSAHPTKPSTQPHTQPTPTFRESTQLPEQTTQPDPQTTSDTLVPMIAPLSFYGRHVIYGCHCQKVESELPAENLQFRSLETTFPTESCKSTEFIVNFMDGTKVCVTTPRILPLYNELFRRWSEPATEAPSYEELVTSAAPLDPTTELPITTLPNLLSFSAEETDHSSYDHPAEREPGNESFCDVCVFETSLDSVDPNAAQFLNVMMQSFPCPVLIHGRLKDENDFCSHPSQSEFKTMVEKLESPPPHEDHLDPTPKNISDGCWCQDGQQKPPNETSPVLSTMIWPLGEACNSTEYIETLMNGQEVCVTALSLLADLESALPRQSEPAAEAGRDDGLPNGVAIISGVVGPVLNPVGERGEVGYIGERGEVGPAGCLRCAPLENWNNVDPKDVQSLKMDVSSFGCPVYMFVTLKNKQMFCVDSSEPLFRTLLEALELQAH